MQLTVTLFNTCNFEEYEIGLPQCDLDEYFLMVDVYDDWKNGNFLITKIEGDFEFTSYKQDLSLNALNNLVYAFNYCSPNEQAKLLAIAEINDNTFEALQYAIDKKDIYELIPIKYANRYELGKYMFQKYISPVFLQKFEDVLDLDLFTDLVFMRYYAFETSKGTLLKTVSLLE